MVVGKTYEGRRSGYYYTREGRIWLDIVLVGSIFTRLQLEKNTSAHSYNIQPYSTFTGAIVIIYNYHCVDIFFQFM